VGPRLNPEGDLHLLDVVGVRKPSGPISLRFAVLPVAENANGDIDTQRFNFLGVRENEKALDTLLEVFVAYRLNLVRAGMPMSDVSISSSRGSC